MTKKQSALSQNTLTLDALKVIGAVPGLLPPVKRTVTWENPETGEEFTFDVYVRRKAYKDVKEIVEGREQASSPLIVANFICDEKGEATFTIENAVNLDEVLLTNLATLAIEVNTKKKQDPGKKSS